MAIGQYALKQKEPNKVMKKTPKLNQIRVEGEAGK